MSQEAKTETSVQIFCCPDCKFTNNNSRHFQSHGNNHGANHPHECDQCNYSSKRIYRVKIHISRDHGGSTEGAASSTGTVGSKLQTESSSTSLEEARKSTLQMAILGKMDRIQMYLLFMIYIQ